MGDGQVAAERASADRCWRWDQYLTVGEDSGGPGCLADLEAAQVGLERRLVSPPGPERVRLAAAELMEAGANDREVARRFRVETTPERPI
jgi:hypothetical protein